MQYFHWLYARKSVVYTDVGLRILFLELALAALALAHDASYHPVIISSPFRVQITLDNQSTPHSYSHGRVITVVTGAGRRAGALNVRSE